MITKFFQKDVADYVLNKVDKAKIIVNNQERDVNIIQRNIFNNYSATFYIEIKFSDGEVLNGIKLLDSEDNLLAQDNLNIAYNASSNQAVYKINVLSKESVLEV